MGFVLSAEAGDEETLLPAPSDASAILPSPSKQSLRDKSPQFPGVARPLATLAALHVTRSQSQPKET